MTRTALEAASLGWLVRWVGDGELDGSMNNSGPSVERWRAVDGTGGPVGGRGSWCAVVQCAADELARKSLQLDRAIVPSRGAKRYVRNVAAAGRWVAKPLGPFGIRGFRMLDDPAPGDRICWHRGRERWKGHVARIIDTDGDAIRVIEGNRNNRTDALGRRYAVVGRRWIRDWQKGLYGIARFD